MKRMRVRKTAVRWALNLLTAIVLVLCVFPFVWTIMTSLKTRVQTIDPSVWVFKPTAENYQAVATPGTTAEMEEILEGAL